MMRRNYHREHDETERCVQQRIVQGKVELCDVDHEMPIVTIQVGPAGDIQECDDNSRQLEGRVE